MKNHDCAGDCICSISDGSSTVFDASFRTVFADQSGVVGQPDNYSVPQNYIHRILRRLASVFTDNVENFIQRLADASAVFQPVIISATGFRNVTLPSVSVVITASPMLERA